MNGVSNASRSYRIRGLPASTPFRLFYWNHGGHGRIKSDGSIHSDGTGMLSVQAPLHGVFAVTTIQRP